MSKEKTRSRLAEILGVEEDEVWEAHGTCYRIHEGMREYRMGNGWFSCANEADLTGLITHPESIIRKSQFTEEELNLLRAIKNLMPNAEYIERLRFDGCVGVSNNNEGWLADFKDKLFPTIHPGQSIKLADILGEEED